MIQCQKVLDEQKHSTEHHHQRDPLGVQYREPVLPKLRRTDLLLAESTDTLNLLDDLLFCGSRGRE